MQIYNFSAYLAHTRVTASARRAATDQRTGLAGFLYDAAPGPVGRAGALFWTPPTRETA